MTDDVSGGKGEAIVAHITINGFSVHSLKRALAFVAGHLISAHAPKSNFILVQVTASVRSVARTETLFRRKLKRPWSVPAAASYAFLAFQMLAGPAAAQPAPQPTLAPVRDAGAPNTIPGQYIVVFKPDIAREVALAAEDTVRRLNGVVLHTYTSALIGFSAKLPPAALEAVRAAPGVAYIEADKVEKAFTIELNAPTGLQRTSKRLLPLPMNGQYTYSETGLGVNVYVIDSGIRVTHTEFGGRAFGGDDEVHDGNGTNDCIGHGTHVAAVIGGATYGIAKEVHLYAVRVLDCMGGGTTSGVLAGVEWVTTNAIHPAVANMSVGGPQSPTLDTAVTKSIASGVTYVVAAGNSSDDACNYAPADLGKAATNPTITVGNIDPTDDTTDPNTNFGTCLELFAPGVNILSAWNTSDTAFNSTSGTSESAPHVTGVAARYLQNHTAASPAAVWAAIHTADDVPTTMGWAGIFNAGAGSPQELLHWGSLNNGYNDGDPHLTTVDGIPYDFQSAGEFVSLRDGNGLQIQTRQTPISTAPPVANAYTGLATCVSINTAVAARVGTHRVTYEPNISPFGVPPLRVDGVVTKLGEQGLTLEPGGRIVTSTTGNGIEIDFADGTVLIVTPKLWASQGTWLLNISILRTPDSEGIMGALAPGSWLPALPNGASLGPRPAALHQRYVELYQKFADGWRVTNASSLFDYAPGTSTATFTLKSWPQERPPCVAPGSKPTQPLDLATAQRLCHGIADRNRNADCVFDVRFTGEPGFADVYQFSQRIQDGSTTTSVNDNKDPTQFGETVTFTATVALTASGQKGVPVGTIQFMLDGKNSSAPVRLDSKGQAAWKTSGLALGGHQVAARYIPDSGSTFLASSSLAEPHSVVKLAAK